ncbi:NTP transferase domain-containing protein [Candidatus Peregrinibacteria bacterium]|nr:NTP transferase domain-containing protein [Candidatus Peregrinibacteria bacterium]
MRLTQAILPVAGLGTRFLPWTKVIPKELLPLGTQPMIALLVDECLSAGITDICFVISHGKELIPQYFAKNTALEALLAQRGKADALRELGRYASVRFTTVYQEEQLGDGHAVLQAHEWVQSDPVAVLFGDDLIVGAESGLAQMARAYGGLPGGAVLLCLEDVPRERVRKYGIVAVDSARPAGRLRRVTGLVEKPEPDVAPSTLGIVGKYLIPRSTFSVLPSLQSGPAGEIRLVDAFLRQLPTTPIYGYEAEGKRIDTGTPEGYREAVRNEEIPYFL